MGMRMKRNGWLCITLCAALLAFSGGMGLTAVAEAAEENTIVFAEDQITTGAPGVAIQGLTATITAPGAYTLTGACAQGQLVVDCGGEVTLTLSNLTLSSAGGPVIDIQSAKQVIIELAAGTQNSLSDADTYAAVSDGQDAAIFSKADLVIRGEGALAVQGLYNDGIASRDTLLIEGGRITVSAVGHGVKGKDYLLIQGGELSVTAGGDAIKATNADQAELGYVQIDAGALNLAAGDDGISAVSCILINGGTIDIDTRNNGMKSDGEIIVNAGAVRIITDDDGLVSQTETLSPEAEVTVTERAG